MISSLASARELKQLHGELKPLKIPTHSKEEVTLYGGQQTRGTGGKVELRVTVEI